MNWTVDERLYFVPYYVALTYDGVECCSRGRGVFFVLPVYSPVCFHLMLLVLLSCPSVYVAMHQLHTVLLGIQDRRMFLVLTWRRYIFLLSTTCAQMSVGDRGNDVEESSFPFLLRRRRMPLPT